MRASGTNGKPRRSSRPTAAIAVLAAATLWSILSIYQTLSTMEMALPNYGFVTVRSLHIIVRDVLLLRERVDLARSAPGDAEAARKLAEANDLVFIRLFRLDQEPVIAAVPAFGPPIAEARRVSSGLDEQIAGGLPLDRSMLTAAAEALDRVIADMEKSYYGFGEGMTQQLLSEQRQLGRLKFETVAVLSFLLLLSVGAAFLLVHRRRAVDAAQAAERSFRDLYENISEGVFRSTLDGRMLNANPSLVRLNGYGSLDEFIRGVNDIASEWYVDPHRREEIHQLLLKEGKVEDCVSEIYRHKTRERIWVAENTRLVRDEHTGRPLYYDGTVREVTETVRRLELQDRYEKIASTVSGCLYQYRIRPDGTASMPYASVGLRHLVGLDPHDVCEDASAMSAMIHPDDRERVAETIEASAKGMAPWQCEYRVLLPDGAKKWLLANSTPEREADGSIVWHGFLTDVTERKRSESEIYRLAYFDALTGLPNRLMLHDRLRGALVGSERSGGHGAVLFIDLDNFKILNDTKGHDVGDLLLVEIARRLSDCVREGDTVARLGGDEFVVLLQGLSADAHEAAAQAQRVGEKALASIDRPAMLGDHLFQTTSSIGLALYRGKAIGSDELLKRADLAMYDAKAAGRKTLRFFEPEMQAALEDRLALTSDLRRAVAENQFRLVYQMQVDSANRCLGAEALLRWRHPTRGDIPPADFLPLAEDNGLLGPLDEWILKEVCAVLKSWEGVPLTDGLHLAVNVSPSQFHRSEFAPLVRTVLAETGADPSRLKLELTEHVMLDDVETVADKMRELNGLGVRFSLDDFGTGYSSLSYLKRFPLDELKIDRSFVSDIETDPSDRAIVQTIVAIARTLNLSVIAEGVERESQVLLLRRQGCHAFQGYLFGRPMPLDDLTALLAGWEGAWQAERLPIQA